MRKPGLLLLSAALLLQSCSNNDNPNRGKPIVLGDSSTIVTENDPQYLQDFVADIKMKQAEPEPPATPAPVEDTAAKQAAAEKEAAPQAEDKTSPAVAPPETQAPKGNGLTVAFKDVTVLIPNIVTRSYRQQNLQKANGASYELVSGNINGNHIRTSDGKIAKVSQRYQTIVAIKNELGTLYLESLNTTSDWEALKGRNNDYTISGLDDRHLEYLKTSPAGIRNAVTRAARSKRMSRATEQKWLNSIKHVRNTNQKPMVIVLRSVMWKIDGKGADGRNFSKQIRLDIPLK